MTSELQESDLEWLRHRERVSLDPGTINLNTGTLAPTPLPVLAAVTDLRRHMAASPSNFCWRLLPPRLQYARSRLADYLGVAAADLLLVANVTFALNLVATSLDLPPGSEVLTTDHEYGAMRFLWKRLAADRGWQVREATLPIHSDDANDHVAAVEAAMTPRTRVLFFSHVTSPTGLILPAADLCRLTAERGILSVIDGAHAPGMIPVDLTAIGADFYGANSHKWLMAPNGSGFLHVAPQRKALLQPQITSWGWEHDRVDGEKDSGWGGSFWARNLEFHGTEDRCPQLVLPEVLDFRLSLGGEAEIHRRTRRLAWYARRRIEDLGYRPAAPVHHTAALQAFEFPLLDPVQGRDWLWHTHRIEAPFTTVGDQCYLRVSTCWFNTQSEIDRLVEILPTVPVHQLAAH